MGLTGHIPPETTDRHRKPINNADLAAIRQKTGEQNSPNFLLDSPKIGRLSQKGGSSSKVRKQVPPMVSKVTVNGFVAIHPQRLSRNFHRYYFRIR